MIREHPKFSKLKKKIHRNQLKDLDDAIMSVINNPEIGELKIGDLSSIRVYKFQITGERWLLAYKIENNELILLLMFGSHQNFYEDLKRLLKS